MCGIIGAFNKETKASSNNYIVNQYEDQYQRGSQGFGSVFIARDGGYKVARSCEPTKALLDLYTNKAPAIIFHHRFPTSSANKLSQTHPIKVDNGSLKHEYLIVHNGVISNDDALKTEHEALGFVYTTVRPTTYGSEFNDSEAIAIEFARFIEKQTTEVGAIGSASLMALQIDKQTDKVREVFFCRHGNPLNMEANQHHIRISSEGKGDEIKEDVLYHFNFKDFKIKKRSIAFKVSQPVAIVERAPLQSRVNWGGYTERNSNYITTAIDDDMTDLADNPLYEQPLKEYYEEMQDIAEELIGLADDSGYPQYIEPKYVAERASEAATKLANTIKNIALEQSMIAEENSDLQNEVEAVEKELDKQPVKSSNYLDPIVEEVKAQEQGRPYAID